MTLGAFRLNGIAFSAGERSDFFSAADPYQYDVGNYVPGYHSMEFLGIIPAARAPNSVDTAHFLIGVGHRTAGTEGAGALTQLHGLGSSSLSGNSTFIEVFNNGSGMMPSVSSAARGANYKNTPPGGDSTDSLFATYLATDSSRNIKLVNIKVSENGGISDKTSYIIDSGSFNSNNLRQGADHDAATASRAMAFFRHNDNDGKHSSILYNNCYASDTPTQYASTANFTPYGDDSSASSNLRYRTVSLPDDGCNYRGVYMANSVKPYATFYSYDNTSRSTSSATAITKTDDTDSVPLLARLGDSKVVYGIYAPSTDKMYLRAASHSYASGCQTGTTSSGSEIEIDAQDGGNIIEGFEDDRFYVVHYSNANSNYKIRTFKVTDLTIEEIGSGQTVNAVYTPINTNLHLHNSLTQFTDPVTSQNWLLIAYAGGGGTTITRRFKKV